MRGNLGTHAHVLACIYAPVRVRVLMWESICKIFYLWRKAHAVVRVAKTSCVGLRFNAR